MRILFLCLSTLKFDVETPTKEPLGGTESAIAYLSVELARLGHDVTLMAQTEEKLLHGVKHVPVSEDLAPLRPDVVIVTSAPQAMPAVQNILPDATIILWNHMRPDQPAMQPLLTDKTVAAATKNIVYVSDVQRASFTTLQARADLDGVIINNAIAPCFENMFSSAEEILKTKQCRGVYTSTPFRGLAILSRIQEMEIDVYSSMRVYQGDDTSFQAMYDRLRANDCLRLHGSVSQTELAVALRPIAFLTYPSIFAECHSIALLEAMAAGLKVVTTDMASPQTEFIDALPSKDAKYDDYARLLRKNINFFRSYPEEWAEKIWQQVQYVNRDYTWRKKALEWEQHLYTLAPHLKKPV